MADINITLPAMGESITEATVTRIMKQVGDVVKADETIMEIATDKIDSEITASQSGIITELLVAEDDTPQVGDLIAVLKTEGEAIEVPFVPVADKKVIATRPINEPTDETNRNETEVIPHKTTDGRFISPLVRSIAKKEGIELSELSNIAGTGISGRLTKDDVLGYIKNGRKPQSKPAITPTVMAVTPATKPTQVGKVVKMDRMRKLIADHMIYSKQTSAHVTSFIEIDLTNMVKWRNANKAKFQDKYGQKLTFTPIFIEATAHTLLKHPGVNVSVSGDEITYKSELNIGMATALPSGNLIVPVIKNAQLINLAGISSAVNDLANRARNNKLKPAEIQGGTFTITNLGQFGNLTGTPIINQPQVAILAVGAIKKKPAVIETDEGDMIAIRHIMVASMSYDHRVVDGALGGMFLKTFANYLEGFNPKREV